MGFVLSLPFQDVDSYRFKDQRKCQTKLADCLLRFALFGFSSQPTRAENHGACIDAYFGASQICHS